MSDSLHIWLAVAAMGIGVAAFTWSLFEIAAAIIDRERKVRLPARQSFVDRDGALQATYPMLVALTPIGGAILRASFGAEATRNIRKLGLHEEEMDVDLMGAICLGSAITFALLASIIGTVIGVSWIGVMALAPGWYIPLSSLDGRAQEHQRAVARRFPFFLEVAALAMRAGATFRDSCQLFVRENQKLPLSIELGHLVDLMNRGKTEEEALSAFAERAEDPEIAVSVNTIVQGQELGTPLASLIAHQATIMRNGRVRKAEKLAEEASVRMTGPTTIIMVASLVLIMGPMILNAARSGMF